MSRLDLVTDAPKLVSDLQLMSNDINRHQRIGGGNLLGYKNVVDDAPYDVSFTDDGSIGVTTVRSILVIFVSDNQNMPIGRVHAVVNIDGVGLWTPEEAVSLEFLVEIVDIPEFVNAWEVIFTFNDVRTYNAKVYVVATDTGSVTVEV